MPLEAAPGTRSEYSDLGFILLGRILEDVAGAPLDETFHREIALPLEMQSMHYCPPPTWKNAIPPTQDDTSFRRRVVQGEVHDDNALVLGGVSGHAGLFSNALDPLRFARCLLAGGRTPENKQLFQEETVRLFTTRARNPKAPPVRSAGIRPRLHRHPADSLVNAHSVISASPGRPSGSIPMRSSPSCS